MLEVVSGTVTSGVAIVGLNTSERITSEIIGRIFAAMGRSDLDLLYGELLGTTG